MATTENKIPELIKDLEKKELEKLVVLAAKKNKEFYDYILLKYSDKKEVEQNMFDETIADINTLRFKRYKGFSELLQYANMLAAMHKRINQFEKTSKNKQLTMDLILFVLEEPFSFPAQNYHTCFNNFNHRVALLVKKAMSIYKKLHEDIQTDYTEVLNNYLSFLKKESGHLDFVYDMPDSLKQYFTI